MTNTLIQTHARHTLRGLLGAILLLTAGFSTSVRAFDEAQAQAAERELQAKEARAAGNRAVSQGIPQAFTWLNQQNNQVLLTRYEEKLGELRRLVGEVDGKIDRSEVDDDLTTLLDSEKGRIANVIYELNTIGTILNNRQSSKAKYPLTVADIRALARNTATLKELAAKVDAARGQVVIIKEQNKNRAIFQVTADKILDAERILASANDNFSLAGNAYTRGSLEQAQKFCFNALEELLKAVNVLANEDLLKGTSGPKAVDALARCDRLRISLHGRLAEIFYLRGQNDAKTGKLWLTAAIKEIDYVISPDGEEGQADEARTSPN